MHANWLFQRAAPIILPVNLGKPHTHIHGLTAMHRQGFSCHCHSTANSALFGMSLKALAGCGGLISIKSIRC